MKGLRITVTGKVQGVYFRASARSRALELGLSGFARNEPDGKVCIEVEGDETSLESFVQWCKVGPSRARVEQMRIEDQTVKAFFGFEIK